jgi:hypothetical protein
MVRGQQLHVFDAPVVETRARCLFTQPFMTMRWMSPKAVPL